jgi:hypothetical protein
MRHQEVAQRHSAPHQNTTPPFATRLARQDTVPMRPLASSLRRRRVPGKENIDHHAANVAA